MTPKKKVSIADLFPAPQVVDLGHKQIEVYGLTIEQLAHLLDEHQEVLLKLLDTKQAPDIQGLLRTSPRLCTQLIAYGLNLDVDEMDAVHELPASTQILILLGVWDATVPELKKLGARFNGLLSAATKGLAARPVPNAVQVIPASVSPSPSEPTSSSATATD